MIKIFEKKKNVLYKLRAFRYYLQKNTILYAELVRIKNYLLLTVFI